MAEPSMISNISESLLQYGVLGIFAGYFVYIDWRNRNDVRAIETARIAREALREAEAKKREEDCVTRIRELEQHHKNQLLAVIVRNNTLLEAILRKGNIELHTTPIEGLGT